MIFLDEKGGPDERDEIDLLTGSGGEEKWEEPRQDPIPYQWRHIN
jgi:hypothetical protein